MASTYFRDLLVYTRDVGLALKVRPESEIRIAMSTKQDSPRCNSSMQLTRAADYGVRVMVHLATTPRNVRVLLPALAEATEAPVSFLSKVLQALAHAGLIWSQRGVSGGFEISERGRKASMRAVIEAIDGPIRLNVCTTYGRSCARKAWCPAHPVWIRAQQALLDVLDQASVTELAAEQTSIAEQPRDHRSVESSVTHLCELKIASGR
jgi:Rrf2 family iron-sulfur cluster assembly transcriptional regulator